MVRGVWCADFETTTEENLKRDGYVRVWLWSLVQVGGSKEFWGTDGQEFIRKVEQLKCKKVLFHNLAFDGCFLLSILNDMGYEYGIDYETAIDKLGTWYFIQFHGIKFWDSLKKFPDQSVNDVAMMYGIEGKKEKPFFETYRPLGYHPTDEEVEYCLQDSRIIAYAIEKEYRNGHNGITLSADAFNDVKTYIGGRQYWRSHMPLLDKDVDWFVRLAYKGGCVQVNPKYRNKDLKNIRVYDINSMYPYIMATKRLPYDYPKYRTPNFDNPNMLWIVRFKTRFHIKPNHIPTIQIRRNPMYRESEYLTKVDEEVELSLTCVDYKLFHDQYDVEYERDHVYLCFNSKEGLLKPYVDKWMETKKYASKTKNASLRFIAKRYLNSPYGKTGMRPDRVNNQPYFDDDGMMRFHPVITESESIYCPYATFVCAYARDMIIRSAQAHYDDFVYMDTDSLHLLCDGHDLWVDPVELGAFKLEGVFEMGKYLRAKTYIHAHKEGDETVVDEIKCSGMPQGIKDVISYEEFKIGAEFGGKLGKTRVLGGCLLRPTTFRIKDDPDVIGRNLLEKCMRMIDPEWQLHKARDLYEKEIVDKSVDEDQVAYLEDCDIKEKDRYWYNHKSKAYRKQKLGEMKNE